MSVDTEITSKILPLLIWPDDRLHQISVPVEQYDEKLSQLIVDMFTTMQYYEGVGLSAPQVNEFIRVIVVMVHETNPIVLINPTIEQQSDELYKFPEGCLSVPGYFEDRERPKEVKVSYFNQEGVAQEDVFYDLEAFAIQHEIDHLDGKIFVDNISPLKRDRVKRKIKKALRRGQYE